MLSITQKDAYSYDEIYSAVASAHRKHYIAESIAAFAVSAFACIGITMEALSAFSASISIAFPPASIIALSCVLIASTALAITCAVQAFLMGKAPKKRAAPKVEATRNRTASPSTSEGDLDPGFQNSPLHYGPFPEKRIPDVENRSP